MLRGRGPAGLLDPLLGALGALMPSEKSRAGSWGASRVRGGFSTPAKGATPRGEPPGYPVQPGLAACLWLRWWKRARRAFLGVKPCLGLYGGGPHGTVSGVRPVGWVRVGGWKPNQHFVRAAGERLSEVKPRRVPGEQPRGDSCSTWEEGGVPPGLVCCSLLIGVRMMYLLKKKKKKKSTPLVI